MENVKVELEDLHHSIDIKDDIQIFEHQQDSNEQPGMRPQSEDNVVKVLIGLIQNKRPLWDHRLPISERGKNEKDKLWSEVWKEMGGILTIENIQKKWKNLRDQFMKTKAQVETYVPSGHDTDIPNKKKVWKHYESLKFLHDTIQPRTFGNLDLLMPNSPLPSNLELQSDEFCASSSDMPSTINARRKIRKRKHDNYEGLLLKVLDKPIPAPQQLSPSLVMASSLLEKLPMKVRMKAERDFINKLYDLVEEHAE